MSIFSKGKEAISRLVQKFRNAGPSPSYSGGSDEGPGMLELLVSGGKVGLIIGKGGETIKMLMVSYMFVILRLTTYKLFFLGSNDELRWFRVTFYAHLLKC